MPSPTGLCALLPKGLLGLAFSGGPSVWSLLWTIPRSARHLRCFSLSTLLRLSNCNEDSHSTGRECGQGLRGDVVCVCQQGLWVCASVARMLVHRTGGGEELGSPVDEGLSSAVADTRGLRRCTSTAPQVGRTAGGPSSSVCPAVLRWQFAVQKEVQCPTAFQSERW
jgi:hypothetical protein